MKRNIGTADKTIRICIAISVFILAFTDKLTMMPSWLAWFIGGVFFLTGIIGFSLFYAIFGFDTYNIVKKKKLVR